jgi:hypothetical protein
MDYYQISDGSSVDELMLDYKANSFEEQRGLSKLGNEITEKIIKGKQTNNHTLPPFPY